MSAARVVFGRDGYARTSIDAIAGEAGVSTRTIYNHFEGKEQLFNAVLWSSATQVADQFVGALARDLPETSAEPDLVPALEAVGRAVVAQSTDNAEHFAMVRQINAEAAHFPASTLASWREAGPLRVEREVARQLQRLADRGLLSLADPARAASHFIALTAAETTGRSFHGAIPRAEAEVAEAISAGVRAFLDGYAARPRPMPGSTAPR